MERYVVKETGVVLTDEMIEALADEAEKGYDLSCSEIVRVGRPPLGAGESESPRITIRTEPLLNKAVRARAAAEGRSVSDLARVALEKYVWN